MMVNDKKDLFKYYRLIGNIHDVIDKSDNADDAMKACFKILTDKGGVTTAISWYLNEEDGKFHPEYWIGDLDFTQYSIDDSNNIISDVYRNENTIKVLDYHAGDHPVIDHIFTGTNVSSLICTPFLSKSQSLGCLLLVKTDGTVFSEEDADVCEILSLFISMELEENELFTSTTTLNKVILSARNIKKKFTNGDMVTQVLKGVNLDVYEGELLVVLGESGCGKSTMLNIIGGMDQADEGTFTFEGKDMSHATQQELTLYRRNNIGFIFQSYNLMPNLNAKQNLDLIGELVENPLDSEEALELVGLLDKKNNYPSQLSGGQQQRISIARALIKRPKLIFADEPTAALDYATSIEVLEAMENIVHRGATIVMVTHNEEITRMASRVIRMRNGKTYEITINRKPAKARELVW